MTAAGNEVGTILSSDSPETSKKRVMIDSLTGVRALAALWVVVGHFCGLLYAFIPASSIVEPVLSSCYLGVDLFFILSGFILTHTYLAEFSTQKLTFRRYGRFLWMRLARIYPVHLFCLVILLVAVIAGSKFGLRLGAPDRLTWWDFCHHLFLTHAWGFGKADSWNGPAWSISAEWAAYLVFPLLCLGLIKVRSPRLAWVGIFVCCALLWAFFGETRPTFAPRYDNETDRPLVRILTEFTVGCLLYRIYQSGWGAQLRWSWVAGGSALAVLVYIFANPPVYDLSLLPAPILALFILALAHSKTGISALLATPFFIFWGEVSYALYMTHGVIYKVITRILPPERYADSGIGMKLGITTVYVAVVFGVAVATYLLIEQPARRWMRNRAGKSKTASAASEALLSSDSSAVTQVAMTPATTTT